MYRIIGADGKEYGPISPEQVQQWIAQGRVTGATKAQVDGSAGWKPLSEFPDFANALSKPASTPPPFPINQPASSGPARTSAMAISALVLGILGFCTFGLTAVLGLILGIIALIKIGNNKGRLSGSGLAIAAICVSGATFVFVPILAGLLLPALAKAKAKAMEINCMNNMKQLGLATFLYADDNNGQLPAAAKWSDALSKYSLAPKVFHCPADKDQAFSYAFNQKLEGKSLKQINPKTVLFFESDGARNNAGGPETLNDHRHYSHVIIAFADGSVQIMPASRLSTLRWDP